MFRDLQTFWNHLESKKMGTRISVPVEAREELAEIHRRVIEEKGPALRFEKVLNARGEIYPFPVVTNLFGTSERVALGLGAQPEKLLAPWVSFLEESPERIFSALWTRRSAIKRLFHVGKKRSWFSRGVTAHKLESLDSLPVITSWPKDGGPFFTLPLVETQFLGKKNLGIYRMQVQGPHQTGMHFQIGKGGGFHLHQAEREGVSLKTRVYLGGPPALILAAIAPLPENVPEELLASFLLGEKLSVDGEGRFLDAEFCLEGFVPPKIRQKEGPFGDHYGYYSLEHPFPIFQISQIYHRSNAIYPATVVGKPRQEDFYLGEYLQDLLSPIFPLVMPGVQSLWSYAETGFHNLAAAQVRQSYEGEALATGLRILGEGQLSLTKCLFLTDRSVDCRQFSQVLEAVLSSLDPKKDLRVFTHTSMDTLDYTGRAYQKGSKLLLMGLGEPKRSLPKTLEKTSLEASFIQNASIWAPGVLLLEIGPYGENTPWLELEKLLKSWPLVILLDSIKAIQNWEIFLWTVFTRFDPAWDLWAPQQHFHHHQAYDFPLIIDARMKPFYPEELTSDPKVARRVDERWASYWKT